MKNTLHTIALLTGAAILQGCGGGSMLGTSDAEDYKLTPDVVTEDLTKSRPSESAPFAYTEGTGIYTPEGNQVLLRGINVQFAEDPLTQIDAIDAIAATGANVVRLQLFPDTAPANLEAALNKIVENDMAAVLSLHDDALECSDDGEAFLDAVNDIWLDEFLNVIAQDRYQPFIMINIADGWGPEMIFDGYSTGYRTYIDNYKTAIRAFRKAGFRVPLVIDAPGCGADYHAFVSGRALELMAADEEKNLILSVHGYGNHWKRGTDAVAAIEQLTAQDVPVVMSEFGGSGIGEFPVRHKELIEKGAGDYAANLTIPWGSDADKAAINIALENAPVDVTNTDIFFDIKVDDAYVDDGTLGVQVYLRDVNDEYANLAWLGAWSFEKEKWNTIKHTVNSKADFGWASDAFDITQVATIGLELVANGKPAEVTGAIQIDGFKIIEGSGPVELVNDDFTDDINDWVVPWGDATIAHDAGTGALAVTPNGAEFVLQLNSLGDLKGFTPETPITVSVLIPADYDSSNAYFTFFSNEGEWKSTAYVGADQFTAGEWSEITLTTPVYTEDDPATPDENEDKSFPTSASSVGIQLGGLSGSNSPVLIDNFMISGIVLNDYVEGIQYNGDFNDGEDGWGVLSWGNSGNVVADSGNLTMALTTATDSRLTISKTTWNQVPLLDVTSDPFVIKIRMMIPESYAGLTDMLFQIFMQDSGWANHTNILTLNASEGDFVFGEWMDIEIDARAALPDAFAGGTPQHFGFDFCSDADCLTDGTTPMGTVDPILLDYFIVEGLVPVEKVEVVIDQIDFFYLSHFENLMIDYVEGTLDADTLQETFLSIEQRSAPYSWIAWSWYGNIQDEMDWDMTLTIDDPEALTERGEDIVNGKGGLKGN